MLGERFVTNEEYINIVKERENYKKFCLNVIYDSIERCIMIIFEEDKVNYLEGKNVKRFLFKGGEYNAALESAKRYIKVLKDEIPEPVINENDLNICSEVLILEMVIDLLDVCMTSTPPNIKYTIDSLFIHHKEEFRYLRENIRKLLYVLKGLIEVMELAYLRKSNYFSL